MRANRKKIIGLLLLCALIAFYLVFKCPIRFFTGICCPGCGMTRAAGRLLMLDFSGAFYYHPMVFLMPVFAAVFIALRHNRKAVYITLGVLCVMLTAVYAYRLLYHTAPDIVYIHPENGIIYKFIKEILLCQ